MDAQFFEDGAKLKVTAEAKSFRIIFFIISVNRTVEKNPLQVTIYAQTVAKTGWILIMENNIMCQKPIVNPAYIHY